MANWLMLWQQRTRREQRLLIGMGLLLAVGIIWYALWQPWLSREARWQQMLVREQATLRWMQQLARHTPEAATATKEDLSAVIMREATRQELAIVRLQPQGTRINVTLPACTFQALMTWLDALARQGILASSLAVSAQPTQPGWVTVTTLVLERPHAP
ncbi:type II secretion system protein M [Raoultella ornithinolytica]|uniref:type II secretion system protein GspM n=1 Tax=Raoultella ornithinolytica TaxID=54291 RepID=UPI0012642C6B|nr:type II secretion system protein M [Raoultella ornithinolytica]KAB8147472.1 type II secretion system protein M [Raoultella ornithinolytica]